MKFITFPWESDVHQKLSKQTLAGEVRACEAKAINTLSSRQKQVVWHTLHGGVVILTNNSLTGTELSVLFRALLPLTDQDSFCRPRKFFTLKILLSLACTVSADTMSGNQSSLFLSFSPRNRPDRDSNRNA